jgi:hypothetical protein
MALSLYPLLRQNLLCPLLRPSQNTSSLSKTVSHHFSEFGILVSGAIFNFCSIFIIGNNWSGVLGFHHQADLYS